VRRLPNRCLVWTALASHVRHYQKNHGLVKAEAASGPTQRFRLLLYEDHQKCAAKDGLFAADDGMVAVQMLRHTDTGGICRTFANKERRRL
jgi:hypothetical protein